MARTINDLYNFYQYIVRKERGVYITPNQFSSNLNNAQQDAFLEYFKGYGENQEVHDALRIFKTYQPFTSNASGFVTYPSDYYHLLGSPFTVTGSTVNTIKFLNEDEFPFALTSQLRPVTTSFPVALDTNAGFSIYPQSQQTGAYWYLRRPVTCVLGYSQVGRTITYDPLTSVQLEWEEIYWNYIIALALKYAGINMNEQGIYQFAEQYTNETK